MHTWTTGAVRSSGASRLKRISRAWGSARFLPTDSEAVVFRALSELSSRMRAAVILRHIHDVSVSETAQILGCSEGTVKSQTARGLAHLRSKPRDLLPDMNPYATDVSSGSRQEVGNE